jgi:hypothetical protein
LNICGSRFAPSFFSIKLAAFQASGGAETFNFLQHDVGKIPLRAY